MHLNDTSLNGTQGRPPTMSTQQVADLLGYSRSTIVRMCEEGDLPCMPRHGEGARYRIITAHLFAMLGLPR